MWRLCSFVSPPANPDLINHRVPRSKVVFGSDPVPATNNSFTEQRHIFAGSKGLKKFDAALAGALSGAASGVYFLF